MYEELLKGSSPGEPSVQQICSEFASKATLSALIKLNRMLAKNIVKDKPELLGSNILKNLKKKNVFVPGVVEDYLKGVRHTGEYRNITVRAKKELKDILKNNGYSNEQIEFIIRVNNNKIIDIPYSKKEDLTKIHPGRMIALLEKKKCVQKIKPPTAFTQLINQ